MRKTIAGGEPCVIVWEYDVKKGCRSPFEHHYGPRGPWARLFRSAPDFICTRLFRDPRRPLRYLTVDLWRSRKAYQAFLDKYLRRYISIDKRCAGFTRREMAFKSL